MTFYGGAARAPSAERLVRRQAMEDSLMHRAAPGRHQLTAGAREFRGMTLVELARESLQAEGVYERGMSRPEVCQRALMSTSDFPLTLANVTNRTLRDAYQAAPQTFKAFSKQTELSDFRPAYRIKVGDAPQLLQVTEGGEFKRGSIREGQERIQLATFGRVVGITRQIVMNDDLGAFTRLAEAFGTQALNLESDVVWSLILSNPTLLTDGLPVFCAQHNNAGTGSASSLTPGNPATASAAAISAGRIAMAKQLGDGDGAAPLNLAPYALIVPPELEIAAQQVTFGITPATTGAVVPDSIRSLQAISEPRLSTGVRGAQGSSTAWYLAANPAQIDTVEYAYLTGQDGPVTESRNGFDVDGVEVKVRHDFAAAVIDYRGLYRGAGA